MTGRPRCQPAAPANIAGFTAAALRAFRDYPVGRSRPVSQFASVR